MKLRFKDRIGKVVIQGIGREFQYGDTIDLPDNVAKKLLKVDSDHFEEVTEKAIETRIIDIEKTKKKKTKGG